MLDENRKFYVTASQCYRVMAGFEQELAGKSMVEPDFNGYDIICDIHNQNGPKPKVGELKKLGVSVTGKDIDAAWKYLKATAPVFSDGMESVAREIAMYNFIQKRDEQFVSADMERGNNNELAAIARLEEHLNIVFKYTGDEQRFFTAGSLGVTPDGVAAGSCAEVKNPKDITHMKYLLYIKTAQDMLKVCPEYYWQAQCGLAVTKADCYHWASYHSEFIPGYDLVYVKILPNQKHIDLLISRADKVLRRTAEINAELAKF